VSSKKDFATEKQLADKKAMEEASRIRRIPLLDLSRRKKTKKGGKKMENLQVGDKVTYRRECDPDVRMGKLVSLGSNAAVVETAEGIRIMVPMNRVWKPVR